MQSGGAVPRPTSPNRRAGRRCGTQVALPGTFQMAARIRAGSETVPTRPDP